MEIVRSNDALKLAGNALESLFRQNSDIPVLFLSSGGSALGILDCVDKKVFGPNITCGVLDERFSADSAVNNFLHLKEKLKDIGIKNWFDSVPKEGDTPESLADRLDRKWRLWNNENPIGKIIATMGMGADGHTAGISTTEHGMFHTEHPMFNRKWVVGYDAGEALKPPLRITATFEFLRKEVDFAIVYISGEEKRRALEKVLLDGGALQETPARIFREIKKVKIFTDIL